MHEPRPIKLQPTSQHRFYHRRNDSGNANLVLTPSKRILLYLINCATFSNCNMRRGELLWWFRQGRRCFILNQESLQTATDKITNGQYELSTDSSKLFKMKFLWINGYHYIPVYRVCYAVKDAVGRKEAVEKDQASTSSNKNIFKHLDSTKLFSKFRRLFIESSEITKMPTLPNDFSVAT